VPLLGKGNQIAILDLRLRIGRSRQSSHEVKFLSRAQQGSTEIVARTSPGAAPDMCWGST